MTLYLFSSDKNKYYDLIGKRYCRDYDILQIKKKIELRIKIDELIEIEKNLTLLELIEKKENPKERSLVEVLIFLLKN